MKTEDSYTQNLTVQSAGNAETWQALLRNKLKLDVELQLDFFFYSPNKKKAEGLKELLEEYDYEVNFSKEETFSEGKWLVSGKTVPTTLSLQKLNQWVEWMVFAGKDFDSDFDGWGASV